MTEKEKNEFKYKCRVYFNEYGLSVLRHYAKLLGVQKIDKFKRELLIEECLAILCGEKPGKDYLNVISEEQKKALFSYPLISFVNQLKQAKEIKITDALTERFASLPQWQKQMLMHVLDAWLLMKSR